MICRKLPPNDFVCWPPDHEMVTPWWTMFVVWLTVTFRFLKSGYMKDNGLVGLGLPRSAFALPMGWFLESSRPCAHGTVTAEAVSPTPVIWSSPGPEAARADPGGPMATSA